MQSHHRGNHLAVEIVKLVARSYRCREIIRELQMENNNAEATQVNALLDLCEQLPCENQIENEETEEYIARNAIQTLACLLSLTW